MFTHPEDKVEDENCVFDAQLPAGQDGHLCGVLGLFNGEKTDRSPAVQSAACSASLRLRSVTSVRTRRPPPVEAGRRENEVFGFQLLQKYKKKVFFLLCSLFKRLLFSKQKKVKNAKHLNWGLLKWKLNQITVKISEWILLSSLIKDDK